MFNVLFDRLAFLKRNEETDLVFALCTGYVDQNKQKSVMEGNFKGVLF